MRKTTLLMVALSFAVATNARAETAKLRIHGGEKDLTVTVYDQNAKGKVVWANQHVGASEIADTGVDVAVATFDGLKQCYVRTVETDNTTKPPTSSDRTQHERADTECLIYLGLPSTAKKH